ncbi:MAG: DDE-type integrase/transposase/recombinase, partial [bacterium]|nr:DDE-type integrase/transposase/recombinase [bacterium]
MMAEKKRKSRSYTPEEREKATQMAMKEGHSATSRMLGIPKGTLSCWVYKAKQRAMQTEPEVRPVVEEAANGTARKVAKRYTPSQRAEILEYAAKHGPTATTKEFDVSRWSIREWQRKVRLAAQGKGPSPTTGPNPTDIEAQRDREILNEWHRHPGLGPSQIKNQLRRKGIKTATSTVRRVMEEAGYRPPKRRSRPHDERFEAVRPNHRWALDFLQRYINRTSTFTLIIIDDHSRYVVGHGVDDAERADMVIDTFTDAITRHGKPEIVIHDKGAAFWSWRG